MIINRGWGSPSGCSICGRTDSWRLVQWTLVLGHGELAMEIDALEGRSSNWRRCFRSSMRWWSGLVLEVGWRIRSNMLSPEIRVLDGAAMVWWLSIKGKAMGWIDVGKGIGFALVDWKEEVGWIPVVLLVSGFGGVLAVMVEWAEMPPVCPTTVGLLMSGCGIVFVVTSLACLLLQFVLGFGFVFSFQISPSSFESGLLSGIPAEIWFWVIGPLFIGPNRLVACSRAVDYQPALITLTLMSMLNAWMGYPKGTPDQLCCFGHFDPIYCPYLLLLRSFDWSAHHLLSEHI